MQHPDPNRKKEPCKNTCTACKNCKDRAKLKSTTSKELAESTKGPAQ